MRVVVWDEKLHEKEERVREVYPNGIAAEIAAGIKKELAYVDDFEVVCLNSDMEEFG